MKNSLDYLKEKVKEKSRKRKDEHFYSVCQDESSVLDVGVHPEITRPKKNISTNHFLKSFRFAPEKYVGLSIESLEGMAEAYPGKRFVVYDGGRFPFETNEFDWAYSNAVIEHVGSFEQKLHFIKEMVRVAKNVFFTTPYKYFPIDAHTMVFFIHWNDDLFLNWRKKNNTWMPKSKLNLMSISEIKKLMKAAEVDDYKIVKNRVLGMTMTLSVIAPAPK